MKILTGGKALDPEGLLQQTHFGELPSYLLPVVAFLKFWFSDDLYFETKTSGSTSEPKPIRISRNQIMASAKSTLHWFDLNPVTDGYILCISAEHVGGFMVLARSLIGNLDVLILPPSSQPFSADLLRMAPDRKWFVSMVPMQFHQLLQNEDVLLLTNSWKGILLGGAPVPTVDLEKIHFLNCPVYHSYGMTETVSHIALRELNHSDIKNKVEIPFQLLPGVEIETTDDGCLKIRGGVTNNEWLETRDLVEFVTADSFRFLGRKDRIINSGGLKIDPANVSKLIQHLLWQDVENWEILGLPDDVLGEKVVLVFFAKTKEELLSNWEKADWNQKIKEIKDKKKRILIPKEIHHLEERPITGSQKTDYQKLKSTLIWSPPIWKKVDG